MDPHLLENRLKREIQARKQAETLLEEKSSELYLAYKALESSARELVEQSNELNAILEHTAAAIIMVGSDGKVFRINHMANTLFGKETIQKGILFQSLFAPSHHETIAAALQNPTEAEESLEVEALRDKSFAFPVEVSVSEVRIDDIVRTIWICRDLTRRRALENEVRQAQKMEALGSLASGVAHEINTPVQFVSDNMRFLQDSFEDLIELVGKYQQAVKGLEAPNKGALLKDLAEAEEDTDLEFLKDDVPDSIEQSINGMKRIGQIVGAIKEFSHPGQSESSAVDLNQAIETTILVSKNQWKYVAELEKDLQDNLPLFEGSVGDVNQVLLNLIVNAAHAIEEKDGTDLGTIKITTRSDEEGLVLIVQDSGCGISRENLDRIFDPFFTTKEAGKGTGQGLAITYNMMKKLGGTVKVNSEVGAGTTFRLTIPLKQSEEQNLGKKQAS